jgi:hypothetical protein
MMRRAELRYVHTFLELDRGMWTRSASGLTIWICCGGCGAKSALVDHTVGDDGTVEQPLVCPVECGWRAHAKLIGYARGL